MNLLFEWDERKALVNRQKHGVDFEEAKTVFNDPLLLSYRDGEHSDKEERVISIGLSAHSRLLLVVHTEQVIQGDVIRIRVINCRKATATERKYYAS
jgi:uncharacterized DUF497 family protein